MDQTKASILSKQWPSHCHKSTVKEKGLSMARGGQCLGHREEGLGRGMGWDHWCWHVQQPIPLPGPSLLAWIIKDLCQQYCWLRSQLIHCGCWALPWGPYLEETSSCQNSHTGCTTACAGMSALAQRDLSCKFYEVFLFCKMKQEKHRKIN